MLSSLNFNDLLELRGFDPAQVVLLRHRPREAQLRRAFNWLAAEKPDLFDAFQSSHGPQVEATLTKAAFVASFIGHRPGQAVFVGLYRVRGFKPITHAEIWASPALQALRALGMEGYDGKRPSILTFDLVATDFYADWKGKLVCNWVGERSWCRWAGRNAFLVHAIHEESLLVRSRPDWRSLVLSWPELKALPGSWRVALAQWRGVYFIHDKTSGKGYVGSAYGAENILGRWMNYAATGHGGNRLLRGCDPRGLEFSVIELVAQSLDADAVIRLESAWKQRLHTRKPHGLNDN